MVDLKMASRNFGFCEVDVSEAGVSGTIEWQ